MTGGRVCA